MSSMLADPSTFQDHQYTVLVQGCDLSADLLISADFEIKMFTLEISKDPRQNDFLLFLLLPYTSLLVAFGLDGPQSFVRSHCSTGNRHIEYLSHSTLSFSPVHPLFPCVPETCRYLHHFFNVGVETSVQKCTYKVVTAHHLHLSTATVNAVFKCHFALIPYFLVANHCILFHLN